LVNRLIELHEAPGHVLDLVKMIQQRSNASCATSGTHTAVTSPER